MAIRPHGRVVGRHPQQQQQIHTQRCGVLRYRSEHRRPAAILALAGAVALAFTGSTFVVSPTRKYAGSTSIADAWESQRSVQRLARGGDDAEVADAPTEVIEEAPVSMPETQAEVVPLFQELVISNYTNASAIKSAVIAIFNKGDRAVDLVVRDYRVKHVPMYTLATLPSNFKAAAQVLLRKRDRRLRVRIMQHAQPPPNSDGELPHVFRFHQESNITRVANLIKYQFVDPFGNNLKRQVKLEFAGRQSAAKAIMGIEQTMQLTNREFTFAGGFEEIEGTPAPAPAPAAEGEEATPAPAPPAKTVQFTIFVTAT